MSNKALITVVVGDEKILVPFNTQRTCADLLGEVRRRAHHVDESQLQTLRASAPDGPKLFGEDAVSDVLMLGGADTVQVIYAGPAEPLLQSPVHGQSLSPVAAGSPRIIARPASAPVEVSPMLESPERLPVPPLDDAPELPFLDTTSDLAEEETVPEAEEPNAPDGESWYFSPPPRAARSASGSCMLPVSARRVDWVLSNVHAKLQDYPKGTRLFSPLFSAYGFDNLGLVLYPSGNSSAKPGFCSLGLKAPHGAHLRYKLLVGNVEKFTELRQNVTESWGFVDMCRLEDVVDKEKDQLRLGVEIIDDIDKNESLVETTPMKIDWTIRNMGVKFQYYRKDIALYSEEFSIAGQDKLRMKLYPNGKKEADDGWCSLYLEAPKGSELRCRLSIGKRGMSFDRVEKFGEDSIWGFLTLCRIQDEVDDDCLKVGLQVLETKQLTQRVDVQLTDAEDAYLKTVPAERRTFLLGELHRVEKARSADSEVPSRFRILQLDIPDAAKAVALAKLESLNGDVISAEGTKLKRWIDGVLQLPFGKFEKPIVALGEGQEAVRNYLQRAQAMLNGAVFGHDEPKEKIMHVLCQWISNPDSQSLVLGIQGPPGNGKTTLCRKGIAEALSRPFVQISLGGATDASVLEGHSYTYVGSSWGRIAGLLMEVQCMNPVIFFDELDKVSETPRGEEINGVLTHLTDHSQNKNFADRYFDGIPLDMTRCMFVFSFNDEKKIPPVLRDRLTIIRTKGFEKTAKLQIANRFLLPELLSNVGMEAGDVVLKHGREGEADMCALLERAGAKQDAGGVRGLKQALETAVLHVNKLRLLQGDPDAGKATDGSSEAEENVLSVAGPEATASTETKESDGSLSGEYDGLQKAVMRVQLPLTLDKDAIAKLLPEHESADGVQASMYV